MNKNHGILIGVIGFLLLIVVIFSPKESKNNEIVDQDNKNNQIVAQKDNKDANNIVKQNEISQEDLDKDKINSKIINENNILLSKIEDINDINILLDKENLSNFSNLIFKLTECNDDIKNNCEIILDKFVSKTIELNKEFLNVIPTIDVKNKNNFINDVKNNTINLDDSNYSNKIDFLMKSLKFYNFYLFYNDLKDININDNDIKNVMSLNVTNLNLGTNKDIIGKNDDKIKNSFLEYLTKNKEEISNHKNIINDLDPNLLEIKNSTKFINEIPNSLDAIAEISYLGEQRGITIDSYGIINYNNKEYKIPKIELANIYSLNKYFKKENIKYNLYLRKNQNYYFIYIHIIDDGKFILNLVEDNLNNDDFIKKIITYSKFEENKDISITLDNISKNYFDLTMNLDKTNINDIDKLLLIEFLLGIAK